MTCHDMLWIYKASALARWPIAVTKKNIDNDMHAWFQQLSDAYIIAFRFVKGSQRKWHIAHKVGVID